MLQRAAARAARHGVMQIRQRSHVAYPGHIPLNCFEKAFLAAGSSVAAFLNPYRHDMVAVSGETTSECFMPALRDHMLADTTGEGQHILQSRPRISSKTVDLQKLAALPHGTFGKAYIDWLDTYKVSPDTRAPVQFIDDPELAYVMQRYRECHDFYHVITGPFGVTTSAEVVVKWFEMANMHLPIAIGSSIFGPLRIPSSKVRNNVISTYLPWALRAGSQAKPLISVHWERHWETDIAVLRKHLGIVPPPMSWAEFREMNRSKPQPKPQPESTTTTFPEGSQPN